MSLIDRYIAELGKHLPMKNRTDIQKEIRSTLEDMLQDRCQKTGSEASEQMIVELLKEYGNPEDVAFSYLPERTLIGPQLYPIFSLVCWIALSVLAAVLLITMGIGLFTTHLTAMEMLKGVGNLILELASSLIAAFGWIVVTFIILERVFGLKEVRVKVKGKILEQIPGIQLETPEEKAAWDPRDLPQVEDVEKFSFPGLVAEIVFTVIAMVMFNFFPQVIGFGFLLNNNWTFLQLLSESFFRYMPYINGLWGLQIILNLILLRQGRWQIPTRWLRFGLTVLGIALAAMMLAGPDLVVSNVEAIQAAGAQFSADAARILTLIPRLLSKVVLAIIILTNGIDLLKSLLREVTGKNEA
jgi:hypothetical protein